MILIELICSPSGMASFSRKNRYGRNLGIEGDISGTEFRWFGNFTAEDTVERPILIISMVEEWFSSN